MDLVRRIVLGMVGLLLAVPVGAQERLVPPPYLEDLAKAHHCVPVLGFVADEESSHAAPFELHYEFKYQPPKALLAGWCAKDAAKPKAYTLLIWAERGDHPLRSCPDEIPNVRERLGVKETRVMFGVQDHLPGGVDTYACVAGRWAHYSPEKK